MAWTQWKSQTGVAEIFVSKPTLIIDRIWGSNTPLGNEEQSDPAAATVTTTKARQHLVKYGANLIMQEHLMRQEA